jgi:hypothetical protein
MRLACVSLNSLRRERSFSLILFRFATPSASRLKPRNELRTNRARIADSSRDLLRSPQHLALAWPRITRSSLRRSNKPRISSDFLKIFAGASRIRTGKESTRFRVPFRDLSHPSSLRKQGPIRRGPCDLRQSELPAPATRKPCGYGSLLSQGRQLTPLPTPASGPTLPR